MKLVILGIVFIGACGVVSDIIDDKVCSNLTVYEEEFALRLAVGNRPHDLEIAADYDNRVTEEQLECLLREKGIESVVIRTYRNDCSIDPNALQNLKDAYAVQRRMHLPVNVIHEPCMDKPGDEQFNATFSVLRLAGFGQHLHRKMHKTYMKPSIFLSVEHEITATEWPKDFERNRKLIDEFFWTANRHRFINFDIGVRSTRREWIAIYGCTDQRFSHGQLQWYWISPVRTDRIDSNAADDYEPFGNTIDPQSEPGTGEGAGAAFKQYAWNQTMCGVTVNLNYN